MHTHPGTPLWAIPEKGERYDNFYLMVAETAAQLSFAKRRKVGAVAVNGSSIVAYGFNGQPSGMPNFCEDEHGVTLPSVIHAEVNALAKLELLPNLEGMRLDWYVTKEPCVSCAKALTAHQEMHNWQLNRLIYKEVSTSAAGAFRDHLLCRSVIRAVPWG